VSDASQTPRAQRGNNGSAANTPVNEDEGPIRQLWERQEVEREGSVVSATGYPKNHMETPRIIASESS
jgi:hypothetical protein